MGETWIFQVYVANGHCLSLRLIYGNCESQVNRKLKPFDDTEDSDSYSGICDNVIIFTIKFPIKMVASRTFVVIF